MAATSSENVKLAEQRLREKLGSDADDFEIKTDRSHVRNLAVAYSKGTGRVGYSAGESVVGIEMGGIVVRKGTMPGGVEGA